MVRAFHPGPAMIQILWISALSCVLVLLMRARSDAYDDPHYGFCISHSPVPGAIRKDPGATKSFRRLNTNHANG